MLDNLIAHYSQPGYHVSELSESVRVAIEIKELQYP
jgi:hypothetical protein